MFIFLYLNADVAIAVEMPIPSFPRPDAPKICDALRDLVPFVQFKKREKHPWRSVNFSKVAG